MLKWLARLFRRSSNGNGTGHTECAEVELGEVTKKNVGQHSQKLRIDLKKVGETMDGLLSPTGEGLGLND